MKGETVQEVTSNYPKQHSLTAHKELFPLYGGAFEISFKSLTASIKLYQNYDLMIKCLQMTLINHSM